MSPFRSSPTWRPGSGYTGGFSLDSNGYPVKIQGPRDASGRVVTSAIIATPPVARGGHRQGVTSLPSGLYVMLWDGDASHQLNDYDNGAIITEVTSDQVLTGTTGNRRVYNIQAGPKVVNVGFSLEIHGHALDPSDSTGATDTVSLSNLRIYPPDPSDPTGMTPWGITTTPPKFHPYYLYKLQGARCLRFLDPLATNNNTWANLSHFKPSTYLGRSGTHLDVVASIVTIQEPTGDRYFAACDQVIQITTATPHGLFDGALGDDPRVRHGVLLRRHPPRTSAWSMGSSRRSTRRTSCCSAGRRAVPGSR